jgi:hypothetical protein
MKPAKESDITQKLATVVRAFDKAAAAAICKDLAAALWLRDTAFPRADAENCLEELRSQRFFALMQQLADAFIQAGQDSFKIRRLYVQSLLEQNNFTAAIALLQELEAKTVGNVAENSEARGLMGRAYKQLYINSTDKSKARSRNLLTQALNCYFSVYAKQPDTYYWHGINVVALLCRAERDGISLTGFPSAKTLAQEIRTALPMQLVDAQRPAHRWGYAAKMEACIALGLAEEATGWMSRYVKGEGVNGFELGSTLRQLTEVWQLDLRTDMGSMLLPVLQSNLLRCSGSQVEVNAVELASSPPTGQPGQKELQKVLGTTQFVTLNWYRRGLERCRSVVRIEHEMEPERGQGTGFLLRGGDLKEPWGDHLLLLTNAHVMSDAPQVRPALRPEKARVSFKALAEDQGSVRYKVKQILWTSPPEELDATLIELDSTPSGLEGYPIAEQRPSLDEAERAYIIGHPEGGTLSLSINDNVLLGYDGRWVHYRSPTKGGSSGSPVFNQDWELIALHHASVRIPASTNTPSDCEANEGIWIQSIRQALAST